MISMVRAHGLDPGPTQRPLATGALAGLLASLPAIAVLEEFGWLDALAHAIGGAALGSVAVALACAAVLTVAGLLYGLLFGRGANDPLGGWLFGLAFGFLLWMLLSVVLLQFLPATESGRPVFIGRPVMGLLLGALVWGAGLGAAFPPLHRKLRAGLDDNEMEERPSAAKVGPEAAAMPELGRNPKKAVG